MGSPKKPRQSRWRSSLYARASLFLVLGSGAVIGAVAMLSEVMVEESVERLLGERIDLARTAGALLEDTIQRDLHLLATSTGAVLRAAPTDAAKLREVLAADYRRTLSRRGPSSWIATPSPSRRSPGPLRCSETRRTSALSPGGRPSAEAPSAHPSSTCR